MELLESIAFRICLFAFGDIQMQQKIISASANMKMRRESLELAQWWKSLMMQQSTVRQKDKESEVL